MRLAATIRRGVDALALAGGAACNPVGLALVGRSRQPARLRDHLARAADWLLEANRQVPDRLGFSLGYFVDRHAWQPAYIETTGYILPTLHRLLHRAEHRREEIEDALARSAGWLCNVQFRDGSYGNPVHAVPTVFDTGQVIFGLLAAHRASGERRFLESAEQAGSWLVSVQGSSGAWDRWCYGGEPHAYYTEVSWALLRLWRATGDERFRRAAERQLAWACALQMENGFFARCSFTHGTPAVLHTIAYTIQGILESGLLLGDAAIVAAARRAADALAEIQESQGLLRGYYDSDWRPRARSRCLTGLAQIGIVWSRLYALVGDSRYGTHARRVVHHLRRQQILGTDRAEIEGGLLGSAPAWGRYFPFRLPNWGVKFYIDLLLLGWHEGDDVWRPDRAVEKSARGRPPGAQMAGRG